MKTTLHRSALLASAGDCCLCDEPLPENRVYVCRGCSDTSEPQQHWTTGNENSHNHGPGQPEKLDSSPFLDRGGRLRIPFNSPARFRWWQGGQSPAATARELGASAAEIARLITPSEARRWR